MGSDAQEDADFVAAFHVGSRAVYESIYRDYFATVDSSVGSVLTGIDRETVIHEVFLQLMSSADTRKRFRGGSFQAWLAVLARNRAIDFVRRRNRELPAGIAPQPAERGPSPADADRRAEAQILVEEFQRRVLPDKWRSVFRARFLEERDQPDAARLLGMSRTTLAYQEYRIRSLLRRFVLGGH